MNTDEISLIVSSDPSQGAFNRSSDGSYFEIKLDDGGIQIPKNATSCFLTTEEATVWWNINNVTSSNNVLRITGPSAVEVVTNHNLGYPNDALISATGTLFRISGTNLPLGVLQQGDYIRVESTGQVYYLSAVPSSNTTTLFECLTTNNTVLPPNAGNFERQRGGGGIQQYNVVLPPGLYDLTLMNNEIARQLENAGASSDSEPIISLSANVASQRVQIRFPFPSSAIDLTGSDTPRDILGFNSEIYGNNSSPAPFTETAQNVASFNQINYFLLHCDLTSLGIRFNNQYSQVVSQILINKPPGSQILYTPFNPARISVPELIGATRTSLRVYLTDDQNRRVNTNGEYFSARFKIQWYY